MTHPLSAAPARAALLCLLALAGTCAGTYAGAQTAADPHAADPNAAVPPTRYDNAIRYRVETPPAARPDRNWRDSNAIVAGTSAMSMTMPAMPGMADHAAHGGGSAPATAAATASEPPPHHHHPGMAMPAAPQEDKR